MIIFSSCRASAPLVQATLVRLDAQFCQRGPIRYRRQARKGRKKSGARIQAQQLETAGGRGLRLEVPKMDE